jgi:Ca2+/Na+ antiporter
MGYFDALSSACFKTAQDGRRLFFPWGVLGRGYVIESEQDSKRIEHEIKIFMIVSLILVIGFGQFGFYLQSFVVAALLIGVYVVRAWYLLRRLQRSDERLSLKESTASQARAHSALSLWLLEISSLVMLGGSVLMFFSAPEKRLVAFAGIVLFGAGAALFAIQLVQRNRASAVEVLIDSRSSK